MGVLEIATKNSEPGLKCFEALEILSFQEYTTHYPTIQDSKKIFVKKENLGSYSNSSEGEDAPQFADD